MFYYNLVVWLNVFKVFVICLKFSNINLPPSHLSIYFNNYPLLKEQCLKDVHCSLKGFLTSKEYNENACWGYESRCTTENRFSSPWCQNVTNMWRNRTTRVDMFYKQADFGYVKEQIDEMMVLCEPIYSYDSSLECSPLLRFCRARNLVINFTNLQHINTPIRYNTDVLKKGEIGGHCKLKKNRLQAEIDHMGALQSWAPELRFYKDLSEPISNMKECLLIEKPVFIMKIDASSNMYHHFCDFFNLYVSLHLNSTYPGTFETEVHVLIWESYSYNSPFANTFKAFTSNEIWDLKTFRGQAVCFKNVVFPLLPRMIFGLYYNTPLIQGCGGSGLFRAFSEHILHRLNISFNTREKRRIHITFISRNTKYRRILNEDELLEEIGTNGNYFIRRVSFENIAFEDQLHIIRNTDVLIGIHGAGLTHLLFLPNWASIFELYNCEDPKCYKDLARLRGIEYFTWQDDTKLSRLGDQNYSTNGAHAKFANYVFDKNEFATLVTKAVTHVLNHRDYNNFIKTFLIRDEL